MTNTVSHIADYHVMAPETDEARRAFFRDLFRRTEIKHGVTFGEIEVRAVGVRWVATAEVIAA